MGQKGYVNYIYYIDTGEILRFPGEIKTGISFREIKMFISLWCHSTNVITFKNINEHSANFYNL
jgi:hypothetical protein